MEKFFVQNKFCSSDLSGSDKQAQLLSQFTDYILVENASRWRGMEPFLDTRSLRNNWSDFASQKNISAKPKNQQQWKKPYQHQPYQHQPAQQQQAQLQLKQRFSSQSGFILPSIRHNVAPHLFKDDICVLWNLGKCLRPAGSCTTKGGRQLRHICNHRPDLSKPEVPSLNIFAKCTVHPCWKKIFIIILNV